MTRRAGARSSPDVDRRVTFDSAVWTKPLAFAADAGVSYVCSIVTDRECGRGAPLAAQIRDVVTKWQEPGRGAAVACLAADTPPAVARTSATDRGAEDGTGLRRVMHYVGQERLEKELSRGQPFDDAHRRAAAGARP